MYISDEQQKHAKMLHRSHKLLGSKRWIEAWTLIVGDEKVLYIYIFLLLLESIYGHVIHREVPSLRHLNSYSILPEEKQLHCIHST